LLIYTILYRFVRWTLYYWIFHTIVFMVLQYLNNFLLHNYEAMVNRVYLDLLMSTSLFLLVGISEYSSSYNQASVVNTVEMVP
jgi:hypothetical protein